MNRADRAKQFLPFDTLKGLRGELKKREEKHSRVEKPVLSDTQQQEISESLKNLSFGDEVLVTYYQDGHILNKEDVFKKVDLPFEKIFFQSGILPLYNLLRIEKKEEN